MVVFLFYNVPIIYHIVNLPSLMFRLLIVLILSSFSLFVYGQYHEDSIVHKHDRFEKTFKFNVENGLLVANGTPEGADLIEASNYTGIDFRLGFRNTDRNDIYSTLYRRPTLGVGFYSSAFSNPSIGTPYALYFFLDMPIRFYENDKWHHSYNAAFGVASNFNPYDSIYNPENVLLGSERNCYLHLGFSTQYNLNDHWAFNASVGFKHFSNGSIRKPNSGLNLFPLSIGTTYTFNSSRGSVYEYATPLPNYKKHYVLNLCLNTGSKNYEIGESNYPKFGIGVNYLRQTSYKYRMGVGLDIYHSSGAEYRTDNGEAGFSESFSFALVGSWEWLITERLYVPVGIGVYVHRNSENDEWLPFYERVGLRYRLTDNVFTGLTIKAHGGKADIFEWTMGYAFHHDPNF